MQLFDELKRRNVFRVAGVYAVVGWLLAQAAGVLENSLNMPGWFDTVIVSALLIAFPIAMLLAWAFELTPEGVKLTANVPEGESIAPKTGRKLDYAILGGLALVGVMIVADRLAPSFETRQQAGASQDEGAPSAASIAVLPFADLSPAGDQEYFSDGMAEEILNVLAKVDGLTVASRTSSFQFKGRDLGIPEIAQKLAVRNVVEGSVRKSGETIRITAQLIDAESDKHLWSETFDRPLNAENIFAIQDEIAKSIVEALSAAMGMSAAPKVEVAAPTENLTAYELFLQARTRFNGRVDLGVADALLARAIEQDPSFAKALEMRAALQSLMVEYGHSDMPLNVADARTVEFAERALAIDPGSATAIAALAKKKMNAVESLRERHDIATIIADYDRALAFDPQNAAALNWRGLAFSDIGNLLAALESFGRCVGVDPYYTACVENRIATLSALGRDAEALEAYRKALDNGAAKINYAPLGSLARLDEELAFKSSLNSPDLLSGWRRHDELYQAYRHPEKTFPELVDDIVRFQEETGQMQTQDLSMLLLPIGGFDFLPWGYFMWDASARNYRRSSQFKAFIEKADIHDYWRKHGFPPQCKPIPAKNGGKDDFECE